jgi:peptidoglycan/xylan/chitin deacetylase (PgdA/CDA1 family)
MSLLLHVLLLTVIGGVAALCQPDCKGNDTELSCIFCPVHCGLCSDLGHIDRCAQPGTVHLSIDDGPLDSYPFVLDILSQKNVSASFWLIGSNVHGREEIVRRMHNEGHFIGSHTWSHLHANMVPNKMEGRFILERELNQTRDILSNILNINVTHLRTPYGECNAFVRQTVESLGYQLVFWNLDATDWLDNATSVHSTIDGAMEGFDPRVNSFIILTHLYNDLGLCILSPLIDRIRFRGYEFVSASDCWNQSKSVLLPPMLQSFPPLELELYLNSTDTNNTNNGTTGKCVHPVFSQVADLGCGDHAACGLPFQCCPLPPVDSESVWDGPVCSSSATACSIDNCVHGFCDVCRPTVLFPFLYNSSLQPSWQLVCPQMGVGTNSGLWNQVTIGLVILFGIITIVLFGKLCSLCSRRNNSLKCCPRYPTPVSPTPVSPE